MFSRRPEARLNRGRIATAGGGGAPAVQTPTEVFGANLVFLQDGITGVSLEAGNATRVQTYTDQSGASNDQTTLASAQRPQAEPFGWNGKPAIWYDGNDSLINDDTGVGALGNALMGGEDHACTLYFAAQASSNASTMYLVSAANSASETTYFAITINSTGFNVIKRNGGTTKTCSVTGGQDTLQNLWSVTIAGATLTEVRKNNVPQTLSATDIDVASFTINQSAFGVLRRSSTVSFLTGRMAAVACVDVAATSDQSDAMWAWYQANAGAAATKPIWLVDGNSFSQTYPSDLQNSWVPYLAGDYDVTNLALAGDRQSPTINARTTQLVTSYTGSGRSAIVAVCVAGISNDLSDGVTAATCLTRTETWAAAIKAAHPGATVIITTIPPRTDLSGPEETERLAYNVAILATPGSADEVVDISDITPGGGDGVHMSAAQAETIAGRIEAVA